MPVPALSVVVMAFNERDSLEAQVRATVAFLARCGGPGSEVVVVDDGSTDGMAAVADRLATGHPGTGGAPAVRVVHHPTNLGMGVAIRSGYAAARGEFVTQLPGDGQVAPDTLSRFLPHLADHDLVLSTYAKRDDGFARALVTAGYQGTARVLLGDRCAFTGTMVFRRALLDRVRLTCDSFLVNVELPLKLMRLGVRPAHVTISALARAHGRSKVLSLARVARVVREMLKLRAELSGPDWRGGAACGS
ncbi:MAG: glycosyltransferase family 2 protein [Deltaproteobacteria bacterium]|nr:glycosyltransferase family 2 protein [Deltaproteobacteria bacterium]